MVEDDIAYIRMEPVAPGGHCRFVKSPHYKCTIEFRDGSTVVRCGTTEQHALANAIARYKTMTKQSAEQAAG
ncbi:hypothetical protein L4X63_01470 [Geomonas sp. Red32]|uniref:hypothetical protein n=1 Tax=Geomonas sp. Red32 TaxID=2912856 RepID=UPI00202CC471|nr:hypothetical protein [Geomonas sp. Red32]MCM0080249.1 hypothetical protein [Geomonas sp. Red32]